MIDTSIDTRCMDHKTRVKYRIHSLMSKFNKPSGYLWQLMLITIVILRE